MNVFYKILAFVSTVAILILLCTSVYIFWRCYQPVQTSNLEDVSRRIGIEAALSDDDLTEIDKVLSKDSVDMQTCTLLLKKVVANQKFLNGMQESYISDIRQETNNNIDKMNAWLAFWLAIVGVLGVFVPIALQHKLRRVEKEEFDKLKNDLNMTIKESDKKIKDYSKQSDTALNWIKVRGIFNCLNLGFDHRILSEFSTRDRMLGRLWKEAIFTLDNVTLNLLSNRSKYQLEERKMLLLESFINVYSFLIHLRGIRGQFRVRDINKVVERVKSTITKLEESSNVSEIDLRKYVKETLRLLREIDMTNIAKEA